MENDDIEELISEYEEDYSNYEDYTDEAEYSEIDGNSEESSNDDFVLLSDVVSDEEMAEIETLDSDPQEYVSNADEAIELYEEEQ